MQFQNIGFLKVSNLPWSTLGTIHWRTLFGFAEILVVRVATPQLLARIVSSKLRGG